MGESTTAGLTSYSNIKRVSDEELEIMWKKYLENKTNKELRDKLIMQYIYLTRYVVSRVKINLPVEFTLEDVAGFGVEGLINAVERFSPQKGAKFETYAITRIRGNIIDKIRNQDFLPRNLRQKIKEINSIIEKLKQKLCRMPTSAEVAEAVGLPQEKIEAILSEDVHVSSLYDKKFSADENIEVIDTIVDENSKLPLEILAEKDTKKELQAALNCLPEKEKMVLVLYYHENMTLKEIGEVISISESRACQIHARALMKLRTILSQSRTERLQRSIV